jgi:steroid delta-isomerase-like uncharacterized protein
MSEQNIAIARRGFEEVFNQGKLAVADEIVAEGAVSHDPADPEESVGPAGFKRQVELYRTAFPDLKFTIEDVIADGDQVVIRWTSSGTHKGELMGLAPTGTRVTSSGIAIDKLSGGKIVEAWNHWDTLGLMRQLGAAPPPGSMGEKVGIQLQRLSARRQRAKAGV